MAFVNSTSGHKPSSFAWMGNFVRNVYKKHQRHTAYRHTLKELSRLSDYELSDLNISRLDLKDVAYSVVYKDNK